MDHAGEVGLADGVQVATGLGLVHNVPEDNVEGHLELAGEDGVVAVNHDAVLGDLVIGIFESFHPCGQVRYIIHSLFELFRKMVVPVIRHFIAQRTLKNCPTLQYTNLCTIHLSYSQGTLESAPVLCSESK